MSSIYCERCGNRKMYATCLICYPPPSERENICTTMIDADFLQWVHARLEFVHKEDPSFDYMRRLHQIAVSLR